MPNLCNAPKPPAGSPTTASDTCVLEAGHEGAHKDKRGEFWGGQPES
jgi:hypothetical protein